MVPPAAGGWVGGGGGGGVGGGGGRTRSTGGRGGTAVGSGLLVCRAPSGKSPCPAPTRKEHVTSTVRWSSGNHCRPDFDGGQGAGAFFPGACQAMAFVARPLSRRAYPPYPQVGGSRARWGAGVQPEGLGFGSPVASAPGKRTPKKHNQPGSPGFRATEAPGKPRKRGSEAGWGLFGPWR